MKRIILLLILCCFLGFANAAETVPGDEGAASAAAAEEVGAAEAELPELLRTMSEESWIGLERMRQLDPQLIRDVEVRINFRRAIECFRLLEEIPFRKGLHLFEAYVLEKKTNGGEWMNRMKNRIKKSLNPDSPLDDAIKFFADTFGDIDTLLVMFILSGYIKQFDDCFHKNGSIERKSNFFELPLLHAGFLAVLRSGVDKEGYAVKLLSFLCKQGFCYGARDGAGKTAGFTLYITRAESARRWIKFLMNNSDRNLRCASSALYYAKNEDGRDGDVLRAVQWQEYRERVASQAAAEPEEPSAPAPLSLRDRKRLNRQKEALERRKHREEMRPVREAERAERREDARVRAEEATLAAAGAAAAAPARTVDTHARPEVEPERSPMQKKCGCGCERQLRKGRLSTYIRACCQKCGNDRLIMPTCWHASWIHSSVDGTKGFACDNVFADGKRCGGILESL
jgi:hypothetical protein